MPGKIIKIKASATQNHVPFHFAMGANANIYESYILGTIFNTLFTDYPAQSYTGKKRRGKIYNYYT